jgi:hypothetical protein
LVKKAAILKKVMAIAYHSASIYLMASCMSVVSHTSGYAHAIQELRFDKFFAFF